MNLILVLLFILALKLQALQALSIYSQHAKTDSVSIVTGANGFVGRHVVYSLLLRHKHASETLASSDAEDSKAIGGAAGFIICLVRSNRVENEQCYWDAQLNDLASECTIKVMSYDMLDSGTTLSAALQHAQQLSPEKLCLYHVASTFGPTPDPIQTAHDNVRSAVDAFKALAKIQSTQHTVPNLRLVLTSSMAAVRATNQPPLNGKYYTHKDWNTLSKLDEKNWGSCYQWSKMESERQVLELVLDWNGNNNHGILEFVALCPSFVFGPPPPMPTSIQGSSGGSTSYSVDLVKQWLNGKSEVQSRLCVDVRDVALAHIQAGTMDLSQLETETPYCFRYILSTDERLSSEKVGNALKKAVQNVESDASNEFDLDKIRCDTKFDGGAIKIGEKEVEATGRLKELAVACRSVEETMEDMARAIVLKEAF